MEITFVANKENTLCSVNYRVLEDKQEDIVNTNQCNIMSITRVSDALIAISHDKLFCRLTVQIRNV